MSTAEIKQLMKTKEILMGSERIVKMMRKNQISTVWLSSNANPRTREELKGYAASTGATVLTLDMNSDDLGILCKRQHPVSIVAKVKTN